MTCTCRCGLRGRSAHVENVGWHHVAQTAYLRALHRSALYRRSSCESRLRECTAAISSSAMRSNERRRAGLNILVPCRNRRGGQRVPAIVRARCRRCVTRAVARLPLLAVSRPSANAMGSDHVPRPDATTARK